MKLSVTRFNGTLYYHEPVQGDAKFHPDVCEWEVARYENGACIVRSSTKFYGDVSALMSAVIEATVQFEKCEFIRLLGLA